MLHVAWGATDDSVVVAWASLAYPSIATATLAYWPAADRDTGGGGGGDSAAATTTTTATVATANTTRGGNTSPDVSVHVVTLRGLTPGARYGYTVQWADSPAMPTAAKTFTAKHASPDFAPRLAGKPNTPSSRSSIHATFAIDTRNSISIDTKLFS